MQYRCATEFASEVGKRLGLAFLTNYSKNSAGHKKTKVIIMKQLRLSGMLIASFVSSMILLPAQSALGAGGGPVTTKETAIKSTISIGTEILDGDTTYQIGYPVTMDGVTYEGYFPFSELKWPLDVVMGRIEGSATFKGNLKMNAMVKKNLSDPDSNMEDSDWITESNPGQLDIYSESYISDFNAIIFDIDIEYAFARWEGVSLYAGLGYQYQKFEFKGNLIDQYSPSGLQGYDYTGDGGVGIGYEIFYHIPYLSLGTDIELDDKFSMTASFAFSPYVKAEDEDDHYLREYGGKVTRSEMDGTAIMVNVAGKYNFTPVWFVELGLSAIKIEVDGTMNQGYAWFGQFGSNKVESESTQTSGYITVGANF